ncbi:MAG: ABC-F family ATP-binding cassette domain-containing protein [Acidobacteria bacterium]|nr:ABC-F family ATP-binding cassette domain-containing protein [Acidobacteriota bacterium]
MIQLTGAGKRFGHKLLFENLNWLINPNDRIGLVGGNGTGKSTLLKALGGLEQFDMGSINVMRGLTMGYLPQDGLSLSGRSVFQECMSVFDDVRDMETELETLTARMSEVDPASEEYTQISERFHRVENEFAARDGYMIESQVGTVLNGLGFPKEDWQKRTEHFSGGWQMRIALAKLLLQKPNILLLDEPTNHLDLEARNWLEEYLQSYPNAFILISHDRYFLDTTVKRIVEIWNKGVHFYPGNYEKFIQQKDERRTLLENAYRNQRERIEALEAFISRFRAQATKAKQVQSRIKELEKIERIEVPPEEKVIHFSFPQPKPSGRIVAEFSNVSKSYGDKFVFGDANFVIERGDRVALVGINGAGKSTLIKLLSGAEPLSTGEYKLGHNVEVDYFAQDQYKELNPDARMIDDLTDAAPRKTQTELRSLLGCFLFSEDDVFKKIGVLSGGERNRYALAKMLLHPSNFVLLDEPTNHLDMRAKDVLLESLQAFEGTLVFVSHDRYFIDKLATRVFEIEGGEVRVFPGNYEDYLWRKSGANVDLSLATNVPKPHAPVEKQEAPPPAPPAKRVNPMKLQSMQKRLKEIEGRMAVLEPEVTKQEAELAVFKSAEESLRLSTLISGNRAELDKLMAEWEELSLALEEGGN